MIRNYFILAWRNLRRNKLYSFINITGLTVGITCCILIGLFIADELKFDKFHINGDRIVRTTMEYKNGGTVNNVVSTGTKVGPQLKRTFPAIDEYVRTMKSSRLISYQDKQFTENKILYADEAFFRVFSFPLVHGDIKTALDGTDKIVLTESASKKYFGTTDVIGKILRVGDTKDYIVSAVTKDVPDNSQIKFDFIINFSGLDAAKTEQWWTANYITYFLLHDKERLADLQQQVVSYMQTYTVRKEARLEGSDYLTYHLEPFTKVHLYSSLDGFEPNGNITYVYVLAVIALLILIIACVNYTNLAIAQSVNRNAEIGVRKVLGALRIQLFTQFIGESLLITFAALLLAILLSMQLLPALNGITGKHIIAAALLYPKPLLLVTAAGIIISFIAGAYPALVLSGTIITNILRAGFSFSSKGTGLRKSLIVVQFVISLFLISTTIIILQQMAYIRNKNLGYSKDHVIVLPIDYQLLNKYDALKASVEHLPGVKSVSGAYGLPTSVQWSDGITADNGTQKINLSVKAIPVDQDFIETMNIQLVAGSDFTRSDLSLMDTSNGGKNFHETYLLNETAVKNIGWTPKQAIGKTIEKGSGGIIKGVIKDFHFASMHEPIGPLVIFMDKSLVRNIFIKINTSNIPALIRQLEDLWKQRVPNRPFNYHFMDEDYNNLYKTEQRTATIFSLSAGIAVFLACLGLFGLAAFTTIQRTKEIGIRKVLGANILNIIALVSKDFVILVACSLVIATPIAWLAAHKWLEDFAYRINMEAWVFAASGISVTLIALVTVSFHAVKVALMSPVKSLHTE